MSLYCISNAVSIFTTTGWAVARLTDSVGSPVRLKSWMLASLGVDAALAELVLSAGDSGLVQYSGLPQGHYHDRENIHVCLC